MFFRSKGKLRKEYDEKLIKQIHHSKREWDHQNHLLDNSIDPFGQANYRPKSPMLNMFYY